MKKQFIAMLLVAVLILSLPLSASAAEETTLPELQYVLHEGEGSMEGLSALKFISKDYLLFTNANGSGVMDMAGRILIQPDKVKITYLCGELFSLRKDDSYALYAGGKALSTYRFTSIALGNQFVRCVNEENEYEYYDFSGNPCTVPKVPEGYDLYDYIPGLAYILRHRYTQNIYGYIEYKYSYYIMTWEGLIQEYTDQRYTPATILTENLIETDYAINNYYTMDGNPAFRNMNPITIFMGPDKETFILFYGNDGEEKYRVYDKMVNPLFDIEAVPWDGGTNYMINYIDNDKILYQKGKNEYVVVDTNGNVLKEISGKLISLGYSSEEYGYTHFTNRPVAEGVGFLIQNGNELRFYRSDLTGSFKVPGYCRVYGKQKMIQSFYSDKSEAVYNLDGVELIHEEGAFPIKGLLSVTKDGIAMLCNENGDRLTSRDYTSCGDTWIDGIAFGTDESRGGSFLLANNGRELNKKAFTNIKSYPGSMTMIVERNGKYGLVRIYTGEGSPFIDVSEKDWYWEGATYCAQNGLFNGTEAGRFSPEHTMTRAMLVTVLWRMEGQPAPQGTAVFSDVAQGLWYSDSVQWAAETGIVNGIGQGRFNPDGDVTREQIATILCRYAGMKGENTNQAFDLSTYPDAESISGYAKDAMAWANATELINGVKVNGVTMLQPHKVATRAQVATILMRYITQ